MSRRRRRARSIRRRGALRGALRAAWRPTSGVKSSSTGKHTSYSRFAEPEGYTVRWILGVLGAAAVLGSLLGLTLPLSLQSVDRSGMPIACGIGFHPDHHVAAHEDAVNQDLRNTFGALYEPSDYAAQCDAIVYTRR